MNTLLQRTSLTDQGTFGSVQFRSFSCYSLELPWRNNAAFISCIPTGSYKCIWAWSPRLRKPTYRLLNVPDRGGVLIHASNFAGDTSLDWRAQLLGCISLGERIGIMEGQRALLLSRPAVRKFEDFMKHQPFVLEIKDA